MMTLTYDQLVFIIGEPPVEYKRRNPGKVYAEVTAMNPVDVINIEELRAMLNAISNDIDISLVYTPGTGQFPRYQAWIAAPESVMRELNQTCFKFRKQQKYLDMIQYAYNCQYHMNSAVGSSNNVIRYMSLTFAIGKVKNVVTPFILDLNTDEMKKLIDMIFSTGHKIDKIGHESLSENDFGFGFALSESESDKIYFKILHEDKWEVEIHSSVEYCHFLKVINIAFPKWNMLKAKTNRDDADQPLHPIRRIVRLEKYFQEHQKEMQQNKNPLLAAALRKVQEYKVQKLIARKMYTTRIDHVSTSNVKCFIDSIIERYGDSMGIVKEYPNLYSDLYIGEFIDKTKSNYSKCVVALTPLRSDPDKWTVELYTADMIALFSAAVNKTFEELFPDKDSQPESGSDSNGQKTCVPSTENDTIIYDHIETAKALKLVDEISNMIKDGCPIDSSHEILNCPLVEKTNEKVLCGFSMYPCGAKMQIYRSERSHDHPDDLYTVTITPKECVFSDIASRILGKPDKG